LVFHAKLDFGRCLYDRIGLDKLLVFYGQVSFLCNVLSWFTLTGIIFGYLWVYDLMFTFLKSSINRNQKVRKLRKAVIVFSGGLDSICVCTMLKNKYELYGISFSYGQRANTEIKTAKHFAKILGLKKHKIVDISFMKDLYGDTNVLTSTKKKLPKKFDYSIVVPIRNAIFLSIATAWAFTLKASLVAFGAHKGDRHYPDCRPIFAKKMENALNQGEIDGINLGIRNQIRIWSPYHESITKSNLIKKHPSEPLI